MRAVRFLKERTEQKDGGRTFGEGSVHLLSESSAAHWVKRGVAEYVLDLPEEPQEPIVEIGESNEPNIESPDGNAVDSPTEVVVGEDSADSGLGAEPVAVSPVNPSSGRRSGGRGNRR